ncbi:MAG: GNAT family N-acetyltransferase [Bacteroidales bacterium]|nr:GNAT family N-acetyltransferase [Bacteroidales bacterium]MCF8403252.1 GNAT family N-acetyltransferase [Bacteroidales bacterium]
MTNIVKFRFESVDLMRISNEIRTKVFIEEQNVDPEIEYEYEEQGNYYLLFYDETPIATARWRTTDKGIKLERFALLKEHRNMGLGTILLEKILSDVKKFNKPIYLHSQVIAKNYYQRAGFVEEGDHFFEADIEHVKMEYKGI